jgi:Predicted periplasmic protein
MKSVTALFYLFLLAYLAESLLTWSFPETYIDSNIGDTGENLVGADTVNSEPCNSSITEESIAPGKMLRTYSWNYEGYCCHLTLPLGDKLYNEYKSRTRNRDYDLFASDPYEDWLIANISDNLCSLSKDYGLEESEVPSLCISFVQSLNYTSDLGSSGYEEYPRFPYETLYENGGDCEDTAILAAAILQKMGYDVVLLQLPEHMALGIKCSLEQKGKSFEYEGSNYYYVETTGSDWQIGEIPREYEDQPVHVIPVYRRPMVNLDFKARCEYSKEEGVVDVNVTVRNVGSEVAENTTVYVALQAEDETNVWDEIESSPVTIEPEEIYNYTAKGLTIPAGKKFRVYVQSSGENFGSENITSEWAKI